MTLLYNVRYTFRISTRLRPHTIRAPSATNDFSIGSRWPGGSEAGKFVMCAVHLSTWSLDICSTSVEHVLVASGMGAGVGEGLHREIVHKKVGRSVL